MSSKNKIDLLTPVGRLVQGSLYTASTTDAEGKPLTTRTGVNAGQPRVEFYFAIAIEKKGERHWSETTWGAKIWNCGHAGFPNGQAQSPTFAWKIVDGDSAVPNRVGKKPCEREGYAGHWVLNFSSGFAPQVCSADGSQTILETDAVKLGDYIQVLGSVADNESSQQPGVFLNHAAVALAGYGKRITIGIDVKSAGFGGQPLPAGASAVPLAQFTPPATVQTASPVAAPYSPPPVVAPVAAQSPSAPAPYPGILTPPVPPTAAAPVRTMLPAAQGATYDQLIAIGWTDATLVQHGLMQA